MNRQAELRARREIIGMSQALLAELMDVNLRSVKRWENPSYEWEIPQAVWALLEHYEDLQRDVVEEAVDSIENQVQEQGFAPEEISLTYWHSAEDYEEYHPGEGKFWQMANANSRLIAFLLTEEDYEVSFNYRPD